jgi:3-oxoacyl-[acyl-carrier protein] reductase
MSRLSGKRALVTGGSRGIGAAIALRLAQEGADVALTYERSADKAAEIVRAIEALGRKGVAIAADSADVAAVKGGVEKAVSALGGLDILVNNAGIWARAAGSSRLAPAWPSGWSSKARRSMR